MQKGDAAFIKNNNKQLVLTCIRDFEPISRSQISKRIQISKPSVSLIVEQLLQEGWIEENGAGESTNSGGRKPVHLVFNSKAAYVIGVDIGGTKVASGVTCLNGEVHAYREFSTSEYLEKDLFKRLQRDVNSMLRDLQLSNEKILGMGIGVPGVTNVEHGIVLDAPSLRWKRYPVRKIASEYFPFPIYVENDVNTSVLGEQWLGAGKSLQNLIFIAIGTGIGSGMIINGKLFRGSNYSAGEMGYLVTDYQSAKSYHPTYEGYGFLESVASGSSIGHKLSEIKNTPLTAKEAFISWKKGDEGASEVVEKAIEHLGFGIANYISLFDPDLVIIGGGVSESFEDYKHSLIEIVEHFTPQSCKIVPSTFGKEAGIVGAAALFLEEHDSIIQL